MVLQPVLEVKWEWPPTMQAVHIVIDSSLADETKLSETGRNPGDPGGSSPVNSAGVNRPGIRAGVSRDLESPRCTHLHGWRAGDRPKVPLVRVGQRGALVMDREIGTMVNNSLDPFLERN